MEKKIKIIASFDDGSKNDLELAKMLKKHKIPAIFYIPGNCDLTENQIRYLATGQCEKCGKPSQWLFKVGAHTMSHPEDLKRLEDDKLMWEIEESKKMLEDITGKEVDNFCYPGGRFDNRVRDYVRAAGFKEARTTLVMNTDFPENPFEIKTSIHIHPDRKEYKGKTWIEIGYELLDKVIREGGRFEIWGHSWEIEKYNQEEFLDDFLGYLDYKMIEIDYERKI